MRKNFCFLWIMAVLAGFFWGCGNNKDLGSAPRQDGEETELSQAMEETAGKDSVIVAMGVNSEAEAGFDPAYGWGAGEHVHETLIESTVG